MKSRIQSRVSLHCGSNGDVNAAAAYVISSSLEERGKEKPCIPLFRVYSVSLEEATSTRRDVLPISVGDDSSSLRQVLAFEARQLDPPNHLRINQKRSKPPLNAILGTKIIRQSIMPLSVRLPGHELDRSLFNDNYSDVTLTKIQYICTTYK